MPQYSINLFKTSPAIAACRRPHRDVCSRDACHLTSLFSPQIFIGKIPRDLFEDELVPLFEKAGPIWDLRLMMDPLSGLNRGYAFVTFCTKEAAQEAVKLVGPGGVGDSSRTLFFLSRTTNVGGISLSLTCGFLSLSAIITRFGPTSTSGCVSLSPTTGCSSARFPKAKQRSRLLRSLLKSQVHTSGCCFFRKSSSSFLRRS